MKSVAASVVMAVAVFSSGCSNPEPPKSAPAKPTATAEAPRPAVDAAAPDARPGMMERYAIWKAQKEADEKLAKQLAEEEEVRLRAFDKSKLKTHLALLSFEKKTRQSLDEAAAKLKGAPDAAAQLEKLAERQRKSIEAQAKLLRKLDPTGGNSNIGTDHDVSLNLLANDYPAALTATFSGDDASIADVRKELDKRFEKMDSWLEQVRNQPVKSSKSETAAAKPKAHGKPTKRGKK